jgi:hypothetical protein
MSDLARNAEYTGTLRDLLETLEKGERMNDGWTEYTLHDDFLDLPLFDLLPDPDDPGR